MDLASAKAEISNPPALGLFQIFLEIALFLAVAGAFALLLP